MFYTVHTATLDQPNSRSKTVRADGIELDELPRVAAHVGKKSQTSHAHTESRLDLGAIQRSFLAIFDSEKAAPQTTDPSLDDVSAQATMKFSKSIQFNAVEEWAEYYLQYGNLKKL